MGPADGAPQEDPLHDRTASNPRCRRARALAQQADLLLLDEPLTAVDAATQAVVLEVLGEQKARGTTVLVATHEVEVLHLLVDDVARLAAGRVVDVAPAARAAAPHHHSGASAWAG